jgi:anti-anti-sigma regulatory factor
MFMGIRIDQSERKCVITCDGELTDNQLHDVRTALIKGLINSEEVALDLQNITNTDLACLQLLCSAHRSAGRLDKHFTFAGPRPDMLNRVAASAGYLRQVGCRLDKDRTCLWTEQYDRRAS